MPVVSRKSAGGGRCVCGALFLPRPTGVRDQTTPMCDICPSEAETGGAIPPSAEGPPKTKKKKNDSSEPTKQQEHKFGGGGDDEQFVGKRATSESE